MASSPDGLISARYAVITKTPGWEVLTTTSNVNVGRGGVNKQSPADFGLAVEGMLLCMCSSRTEEHHQFPASTPLCTSSGGGGG